MSENIRKERNSALTKKKACLEHRNKRSSTSNIVRNSLANLEDSKNLDGLGEIAKTGTSFAHKRALEISDEVIYASEGKIIRKVKGKEPQILQNIYQRKVTKGEVLIIQRT